MRSPLLRYMVPLVVAAIAGCTNSLSSDTIMLMPVTPTLSGSPNFTATVTVAANEAGYTPEGYSSQYDLWLVIAPATVADAGVVVGGSTPVYLNTGGVITASTPASIRVGDVVEIWHDATTAWGAVQAPSGSPAYMGTQVVILR